VGTRTADRTWVAVVLAAVLALVLVACSDDAGSTPDEGGDVAPEQLDLGAKPDAAAQLPEDRSDPPTELVTVDLVEGTGEQATAGAVVEAHYVGVDFETGEEFDASWDRDRPIVFQLGTGQVIQGWDEGIEGMRVGGRRVLTIPPDLAYGDRGSGTSVAPNATIVFVVDLLDVDTPPTS
jgi:peptidylprolyl isomerase